MFARHFSDVYDAPVMPEHFDCLRIMVAGVEVHCGAWTPYSMRYVRKLVDACDEKSPQELAQIYSKIGDYCSIV